MQDKSVINSPNTHVTSDSGKQRSVGTCSVDEIDHSGDCSCRSGSVNNNTNKFESDASLEKSIKSNDVDRSKRKKFKEAGVINEYLASAIPNNIGDESVDTLADYVNGNSSKDCSKTIKTERKIKAINGNKKQYQDKIFNINGASDEAVLGNALFLNNEEVNQFDLEESNNDKHIKQILKTDESNVSINLEATKSNSEIYLEDYENQDDEFYQVVKHKTRKKTKIMKPNSTVQLNRNSEHYRRIHFKKPEINSDKILGKVSEINFMAKNKLINADEKKKLNCFIYHLWIEFQKKHDKYLKEQNSRPVTQTAN